MPLKTYETIGILNRYMTATIDGREIPVRFANGTAAPRLIQGKFTTADKKVQDWLENNGNFNKKFRLISVIKTGDDVVLPEKPKHKAPEVDDDLATSAPPPPAADPHEDDIATGKNMDIVEETDEDVIPELVTYPEPGEPNPGTPEPVVRVVGDEVVNGQQARNYLMDKVKGLTFRQVTNNQQIIAVAKENNIQFAHWEAFVTSK